MRSRPSTVKDSLREVSPPDKPPPASLTAEPLRLLRPEDKGEAGACPDRTRAIPCTVQKEPSHLGADRAQLRVTPEGRQAAERWLRRPAGHPRDTRSELLVKLALLDRAGVDPRNLMRAQRRQLTPIADALTSKMDAATGHDYVVARWRHESILAMLRSLDALLATPPPIP